MDAVIVFANLGAVVVVIVGMGTLVAGACGAGERHSGLMVLAALFLLTFGVCCMVALTDLKKRMDADTDAPKVEKEAK